MFFYFKKVLEDKKLPYTILRGKLFERIEIAEKTLSLIKNNYVTEEDYFQLEESGRSAELVKRQYESLIGKPFTYQISDLHTLVME